MLGGCHCRPQLQTVFFVVLLFDSARWIVDDSGAGRYCVLVGDGGVWSSGMRAADALSWAVLDSTWTRNSGEPYKTQDGRHHALHHTKTASRQKPQRCRKLPQSCIASTTSRGCKKRCEFGWCTVKMQGHGSLHVTVAAALQESIDTFENPGTFGNVTERPKVHISQRCVPKRG